MLHVLHLIFMATYIFAAFHRVVSSCLVNVMSSEWLKGVTESFLCNMWNIFCPASASTDVFLSGGNVTVRGTAETAQTSLPPARLATAGSASFSAMMETAPVRTSCATATRTATMAQMKTLCCVVGCVL